MSELKKEGTGITVSFSPSRKSRNMTPVPMNPDELTAWLTDCRKTELTREEYNALSGEQRALEKGKLPVWLLGRCQGRRTRNNVEYRSGVVLDYDDLTPARCQALTKKLTAADFRCYAFSSLSSTPERPKLHVIIPMADRMDQADHDMAARRIAWHLLPDCGPDPVSFRYNQVIYANAVCRDEDRPMISVVNDSESLLTLDRVWAWGPVQPEVPFVDERSDTSTADTMEAELSEAGVPRELIDRVLVYLRGGSRAEGTEE